jgi:hypothetical protein
MSREAKIVISDTELNNAQSMAVRVAVASMLTQLDNKEYRRELGDIAEGYRARLGEVQDLILVSAK